MRSRHFRSSVFFPLGLAWLAGGLALGALAAWQAHRTDFVLRKARPADARVLAKIAANADAAIARERGLNTWHLRLRLEGREDEPAREFEAPVPREEFDRVVEGDTVPVHLSADGQQVWLTHHGGPGFGVSLAIAGMSAFAILVGLLALRTAWRRAVLRVAALEAGIDPAPAGGPPVGAIVEPSAVQTAWPARHEKTQDE